jgi:hypothetical protein
MIPQEIRNAWACTILGIDVRMILLSEGEPPESHLLATQK